MAHPVARFPRLCTRVLHRQPAQRQLTAICRATATTARTRSPLRPDQSSARAAQLAELIQETVKVASSTGPRGFFRAVQATQAVFSLSQEYLQRAQLDPPQVIIRKLFEKLGTTYIKLGQFIASSPSLFPEEYVEEFQKCLDKADPVPFETIRRIVEKELNRPISDVFTSIDPIPLATASVAQVHRAVLKSSNKEVVIKVLKPGVEDIITTDMNFIYLLTRYLEFIEPSLSRLSVTAIFEDIKNSMIDEVDFTKEATHIQQFSSFLDQRGYRTLATCPYVYSQYSSRRLLTMERLVGAPLTDLAAIRKVTLRDPEQVLIGALNTWFASTLGCETFHADVHAGNLLVLPDGRVGFIDFGIVGRISPVTWKALEALVGALATSDYDTVARALATIGACDTDVDFKAFGRDLESFFMELDQVNTSLVVNADQQGAMSASLAVDQTQVNRLLLELVRIGEKHGIRFPREFGLFLKQLLYFDRYTRILAPSLQVFSDDRVNFRELSSQYGLE